MRVLGIEASSRRGTVALVQDAQIVVTLAVEAPGGHDRHLLALVERALADAGWSKTALDRVGVGVGPGSFTGIRVGVALGQGIGLGLGRPVLGVGSLRAMAAAVPAGVPGPRCALLDARRNELFCAEYDASGGERRAVVALARGEAASWLSRTPGAVVVGEAAAGLEGISPSFQSELTDLPHAAGVALVAVGLDPETAPPDALYVRPADAIRPDLPRSPLSSGPT